MFYVLSRLIFIADGITRFKDANRGSGVLPDSRSLSSEMLPSNTDKRTDLQSSDTSNKTPCIKLMQGSYQDQIQNLKDELNEKIDMIF